MKKSPPSTPAKLGFLHFKEERSKGTEMNKSHLCLLVIEYFPSEEWLQEEEGYRTSGRTG
jgi:hypothetical protein